MKTKYLLTLAVAATAILGGCKKTFLETQPTSFTTPELLGQAALQDPKLLNGNISGLYTTMFTPAVGGTTGHDDFGQKGIDIYTDMLESDMVLAGVTYGWYSNLVKYVATPNYTTNENYIPFRYYYRQIFGANTIIDILGGNDAVLTGGNAITMGQAKAMRAYANFYLSQLYAKEYGDGSAKILPIYKTADSKFANQPKSTAKDVWDLMVKDLTDAIALLNGFTRGTKDQVNQNVAKGLLAYVLAARGTQADWAQVTTLTSDIMAAFPKTTKAYYVYDGTNIATAGFNNVASPSWMWGVDLTLAQGLNLISWFGQIDQFTYSYTFAGDPKQIDRGLYDAIRPDDARKGQFAAPTATYKLQPINKIFAPARTSGGTRYVDMDYVYMRSDEFYLMNAEAKARTGQDGPAKTQLTAFLSDRITDVSYINVLAGQSLLNEIYLQTRIELWGEGKAYLAMKRNKVTITRGPNHLFEAGNSFAYNDPKLTFLIPQNEELNNPNLNK